MIGQTISHYRIIEKLGEGGMGVVYRAEDTKLGREVALKFLPASLTSDPDAKERFVREARAASALDHPNICTIHEIDETDAGQMFICMSCYDGEVLKSRIARGPLPLDEAVDIADHIARGLAKAHSRGIVHRDVKPANVLVTEDGEIKLLDFGLAKLADQSGVTKIGTTVGTATYVSPEQARGREVDHRTDIWSLGVLLYEMVAGRPPFESINEQALFYAIVNEEALPVGDHRKETPLELEQVIQKAMSKDPAFRYADAGSFLADLRSAAEGLGAPPADRARAIRSLPSIAVLPFADMSPERDQEYFCDGMAEELINALTGIERLQVASRTSAFQFKGTGHDVRAVGRELKVGTVLEGSVRKAGNRLRITAQLISVADGYHLWSEKFDRDADDVFAIQDEISLAIVEKLRVKLLGDEKTRLVKRHTDDQEAYGLYLRGRYYWNRRYEGGLRKAITYFQQAIERDPEYALPYVGTADTFHILGYYGFLSPAEAFPPAKAAAMKALEIDDSLGEAQAALGWISTFYDWDWEAAEHQFGRALDLSPKYATTHEWYALYLTAVGRFEEAIAEVRHAQALEPVSLIVNAAVGVILYLSRHHEEATEQLTRTLDMDPSFILPRVWAGDNYTCLGKYDDAIAQLRIAVDAAPDMTYALGSLGCAYALAGQEDDTRAVLHRFDELASVRYVSSIHRALPHIGLGEKNQAIELFGNGLTEREPLAPWIRVAPVLDPLRGEPGFEALVERMRFPGMIGKTISHYRIIEKLGEGGMGVVYRAKDTKLGREVALKFLPPEWTRDAEARARFLHEAQAAAALSHPNICTIYEIDEADGQTFIAMELVEGESLKDRIARGPMAIDEAIDTAHGVTQGLAAAHARGIVHRDIKPGNVMLTPEGSPKIMDFGLAKSPGQTKLTRTGTTTGTVAYMSPEQSRGESVDHRTDVWSFGAMLYEMLTGRLPFRGDRDQAVIHSILNDAPEPITGLRTGVPIELERIVTKAMAKRLGERYQHADDLIADIRSLRRGLDSGTATVSVPAGAHPRRRVGLAALWRWAIVAAVVVIALVMVWNATNRDKPVPDLVDNKVLVAGFENRTGDPSLDPIGQMAGHSIAAGLTQIGNVEVVPMVDAAEPADAAALARAAGARLVISGAYYLNGDDVRLQASIVDAADATVVQSIPAVHGRSARPGEAIEELRQRVMGAVAFRTDGGSILGKSMSPPTYEAFQEYSVGMKLFGPDYSGAVERFKRAVAIDTTFVAPLIYIYFCYYNRGMYTQADSVLQGLERRRTRLTSYEHHMVDYASARLQGNDAEALRALRLLEAEAPESGLVKYLIGYTALGLNRPRESADALASAEFREQDAGFYVRSWGFSQRADALHLLGEYEGELEVVRAGLEAYPDILWLRGYEARALIALGRLDEAEALIDETLSQAGRFGTPVTVMWHAATELRAHVGREESIAMAERAIELQREAVAGRSPEDAPDSHSLLAELLYLAERWPEARAISEALAEEGDAGLHEIGFLGTTAARLGDHEAARAALESLRQMDQPYLFGENTYWAADIASLLGDKELAVRLLQQAFAEGLADPLALHQDMDLEPLHGYPPFEELRRPKG